MTNSTCLTCHGTMPPKRAGSGPQAKYCSSNCRPSAKSNAKSNVKSCTECGTSLAHRRVDAIVCSKFCADVRAGQRLPAPLPEIVCALEGCEISFTPNRRGVRCCSENHGAIHCNRERRASGRELNSPWNEARKANYHKRRAQKRGTQAEDIRPIDIYERDGWLCGLCSTTVDPGRAWPDRMSPSLDHILPLSKGGTHTHENVQLAHLTCNVSKGNRIAA